MQHKEKNYVFSILFQIGPVHKPFIQRYDGCLMVGLGFVIVGFFANSFSGMLNCWHDIAMACASRKQKQMIEEGIQSRLSSIGEESQLKLQDTMKRIVNESKGRIICIIL